MDRWLEVPHHCADPTCPGDRNRRLLEAGERLAKAVHEYLTEDDDWDVERLGIALAVYQEASK